MSEPSETHTNARPRSAELDALIANKTVFPVLGGQGSVRVVDYMGNDSSVVIAARASVDATTKTPEEDARLIDFLMREGHTSPFEMCRLQLEIELPNFVATHFLRHRTASVNMLSGRYAVIPERYYTPDPTNICFQDPQNKQCSSKSPVPCGDRHASAMRESAELAFGTYQKLLGAGIARETARIVLPLGSFSRIIWSMDLHNLFHFLKLRCDDATQKETREYANVILKIVESWVPISYAAFVEHKLGSVTLSRSVAELIRRVARGESELRDIDKLPKGERCKLSRILQNDSDELGQAYVTVRVDTSVFDRALEKVSTDTKHV